MIHEIISINYSSARTRKLLLYSVSCSDSYHSAVKYQGLRFLSFYGTSFEDISASASLYTSVHEDQPVSKDHNTVHVS